MKNNNDKRKILSELEKTIQTLQKRLESKKNDQQLGELLTKFEEEKAKIEKEEKEKEIRFTFWQLLGIYGGVSGGLESAIGGVAIGAVIDIGLKHSNKIKDFTHSVIDIETFVNSALNLVGNLNRSAD